MTQVPVAATPSSLERAFRRRLAALEDWHRDALKARAYDAASGSSSPGPRELRSRGLPWSADYKRRFTKGDLAERQRVVTEIEAEIAAISKHREADLWKTVRKGQQYVTTKAHPGTKDWAEAIATAEGSLREVAGRFGVHHQTVANYRKKYKSA